MITLKVIEFKAPATFTGIMEAIKSDPDFIAFNQRARDYYKWVHDDCINGLTEEEAGWFEKWWNGGIIDWKTIPRKAHNSILAACSMGCG